MNNRKYYFFCLALLFILAPLKALSLGDIFYLTSSGFLIKLDINQVAETGQIAAGTLPWGITSYKGHIYFTDFGTDQVYDFSPSDKVINKVTLESNLNELAIRNVDIYSKELENAKKISNIEKVFSKVIKPKPKPAKLEEQPLAIALHNKKLGLGSIDCNDKYVFVVSTLKNKVYVLTREKLELIATLTVGERPYAVSVSPSGNLIAVSSIGLNRVHVISANDDFKKVADVVVDEGPTDISWLSNDSIAVLNRGQGSVSVISAAGNKVLGKADFGSPVSTMTYSKEQDKLFVLEGNERKLFVVDPLSFTFDTKPINEDLKFANLLLPLPDNKLLIGSEPDGRFVLMNTQDYSSIKKIQTNLLPKSILYIPSDEESLPKPIAKKDE
jgi:WD40 repeat protein